MKAEEKTTGQDNRDSATKPMYFLRKGKEKIEHHSPTNLIYCCSSTLNSSLLFFLCCPWCCSHHFLHQFPKYYRFNFPSLRREACSYLHSGFLLPFDFHCSNFPQAWWRRNRAVAMEYEEKANAMGSISLYIQFCVILLIISSI